MRRGAAATLALLIGLALGCAARTAPRGSEFPESPQPKPQRPAAERPKPAPPRVETVTPLRLSEIDSRGQAARRASLHLVIEGLDAEIGARPSEARELYRRALQVDAANPYAYLALARHHLEAGEAPRALAFVDQAGALLGAQGSRTPGVTVHLDGLRARALDATGRGSEGEPLLERVKEQAPGVWGDGWLSADELR